MGEFVFSYTVGMTLTLSAVILAFLVLSKWIDRKFTAKFQYWTWLILSLRLLLPVSLFRGKPLLNIQTPYRLLPQKVMGELGSQWWPADAPAQLHDISTFHMLTMLWAIGMLVYFSLYIVRYIRFCNAMHRWSSPVGNRVIQILTSLTPKMGVQKRIKVLVCPWVPSPMVVGFSSAVIVLPTESYTDEQLNMVLSHELVHCRRNDVLYRLLLVLVGGIHWFNPLVHLMVQQAKMDIEFSCDSEVVLAQEHPFRQQYAQVILDVARSSCRAKGPTAVLSASFSSSGMMLKKRFANLFDFSQKRSGTALLAVLCAVMLFSGSLCTFRGRDQNTQWAKEVQPQQLEQVLCFHDGVWYPLNQKQITQMTAWLNHMDMEMTPLVRCSEKKMEQKKYHITTREGQVYRIVCRGDQYMSMNGRHYRRSLPPLLFAHA